MKVIRTVILTFVAAVILFFIAVAFIKVSTKEDSWICKDGAWVEHGHPSSPQPTLPCIK